MPRKVSVEALLSDGLVFEGRVLALDTVYGEYQNHKYPEEIMATFAVDTWISSHDVSDTLTIYTGLRGGDCGLAFSVGENWLIYTREFDGIRSTSICTPSMRMNGRHDEEFSNTLTYLKKLKATTGRIEENEEWYQGQYKVLGNLKNGNPVGQWLRVREKDTIAIFNFNDSGRRHGYQREQNEDYDDTIETAEEVSDQAVKIFSSDGKILRSIYSLKNGRRNGKFEVYWENELHLTATYWNGQLHGEYITWHEDTSIAKGKIKTVKQFQHGKLISSSRFDEAGNLIKY
jgi:antitoxin component YwqK of YwqJK toxin-antitoxin module